MSAAGWWAPGLAPRSVGLPAVAAAPQRGRSSAARSAPSPARSARARVTPTPTAAMSRMAAAVGYQPITTAGANGGRATAHGIRLRPVTATGSRAPELVGPDSYFQTLCRLLRRPARQLPSRADQINARRDWDTVSPELR